MTREEAERLAHSSAVTVQEFEDGWAAEFHDPTMRREPFVGIGKDAEEARTVLAMSLAAWSMPASQPQATMPRSFDMQGVVPGSLGSAPPASAEDPPAWTIHRVFRAGAWEACNCAHGTDHADAVT